MKRPPVDVRKKAARIQLLLLDVDGVLTDGRIIIDDRGIETKQFHVRDGQGIALLLRCGIGVGFVSARKSASVRRRAKELGVQELVVGASNIYTADEQVDQIAFYWIDLHGGQPRPLTVRLLSQSRDISFDLAGGNRIPKIGERKARSVAELRSAGVGVRHVLLVHDGTREGVCRSLNAAFRSPTRPTTNPHPSAPRGRSAPGRRNRKRSAACSRGRAQRCC